MKYDLLNYIVCPKCKSKLSLTSTQTQNNQIIQGELICKFCDQNYEIKNGIPILIIEWTKDIQEVANTFKNEWELRNNNKFERPETVYGYSLSSQKEYLCNAFNANSLGKFDKKIVLDAGCGHGRFMESIAESGATIIGMDISISKEAIYISRKHKNLHYILSDILHPPFNEKTFDFIYSIGVLHHTSDINRYFSRLVKLLSDNGLIHIMIYSDIYILHKILNKIRKTILTNKWNVNLLYYSCFPLALLACLRRMKLKLFKTYLFSIYDLLAHAHQHLSNHDQITNLLKINDLKIISFDNPTQVTGIKSDNAR